MKRKLYIWRETHQNSKRQICDGLHSNCVQAWCRSRSIIPGKAWPRSIWLKYWSLHRHCKRRKDYNGQVLGRGKWLSSDYLQHRENQRWSCWKTWRGKSFDQRGINRGTKTHGLDWQSSHCYVALLDERLRLKMWARNQFVDCQVLWHRTSSNATSWQSREK